MTFAEALEQARTPPAPADVELAHPEDTADPVEWGTLGQDEAA